MVKGFLKGAASGPLAIALGVASIGLTAAIVLRIGDGRGLTTLSAMGLGLAAVLAVLASAQASRSPRTTLGSRTGEPGARRRTR